MSDDTDHLHEQLDGDRLPEEQIIELRESADDRQLHDALTELIWLRCKVSRLRRQIEYGGGEDTRFFIPHRGTDEYEFMKQVLYIRDGMVICSESAVCDLVEKAGGSVVKTGPDMEMKFPMYWEEDG